MKSKNAARGGMVLEMGAPRRADVEHHHGALTFILPLAIAVMMTLGVVAFRPLTLKLQAKSEMKSLDIALTAYAREYGSLPHSGPTAPLADTATDSASAAGNAVLEALLGKPPLNHRQIRFWEPPPAKGARGYTPGVGLLDTWGKDYRITLDYDGDGRITDPEGVAGIISADTLIHSAGPDGDFATWSDNVCSWK